jgi:uncharacterized repeat protein (TIGR03806 family)
VRIIVAALALALLSSAAPPGVDDALILGDTLPAKLSAFRFFANGKPNARVQPYSLTTPLFSDYSDKDRFIYVPAGQTAQHAGDGLIEFPVGSALIKTFRYGGRVLETRVLLRRASGWVALPYVWNGEDAVLKRGGTRIDAAVHDQPVSYAVPNQNQCKECHQQAGAIQPIGPKARNLDPTQLAGLVRAGLLDRAPAGYTLPRWDDPSQPVQARARAYLDVNCGHCHSREGIANNSGLFLTFEEADPVARGIGKRPVAAGRGSGRNEFAIAPGEPDKSILLYRMESTEPGVAMPEVGRGLAHREGVALVREYIAGMKSKN